MRRPLNRIATAVILAALTALGSAAAVTAAAGNHAPPRASAMSFNGNGG